MTYGLISVFVFLVFWRPQDWLLTWLEGWQILDAVFYLSLLTFLMELNQNTLRFPQKVVQFFLLAGLWLATIMSHVANTYFEGILETAPDTFKICIFTAILICVLDRPSRLRGVAILFVAMSCVMVVHALMQERLGIGFAGQGPMPDARAIMEDGEVVGERLIYRSYFFGIFGDPNDLAQILATTLPFTFLIFRRWTFLRFLVACGIAWFLILGIKATHSRSGLIAMMGAIAVFTTMMFPPRWMPYLLVAMLGMALAACRFAGNLLDPSAHDRVMFWGLANWTFKQHPLFGIGYGEFWKVTAGSRASHNAFVGCYTELGLFGYLFWFCLIQLGIMSAWRTRIALADIRGEEALWLRRFCVACIAATVGFGASAYFLSRTFIYPFFFLFAMLAVLPVVARKYLPEDEPPLMRPTFDFLAFGIPGACVSIVYIYISIIMLNKAYGG